MERRVENIDSYFFNCDANFWALLEGKKYSELERRSK